MKLVGALVVTLALAGCSIAPVPIVTVTVTATATTSASQIVNPTIDATPTQSPISSTEPSSPTAPRTTRQSPPESAAKFSYSGVWEDTQGGKIRVNVTLRGGVKGTDDSALQELYANIAGSGRPPCFTKPLTEVLDSPQVPLANVRAWVGTVEATRLTKDGIWPGAVLAGGGSRLTFHPLLSANEEFSVGIDLQDGRKRCEQGGTGQHGAFSWQRLESNSVTMAIIIVQHYGYADADANGMQAPNFLMSIDYMETSTVPGGRLPQ